MDGRYLSAMVGNVVELGSEIFGSEQSSTRAWMLGAGVWLLAPLNSVL